LELIADLQKIKIFIEANQPVYFAKEKQYRFEHGILPKTLKNHAEDLSENKPSSGNNLT
jgi:ATP-dependent DNA helicase DinG